MKTAIWWIRRDLRLHDNQALTAAHETARHILPVFILDPRLLSSPYAAEKRVAFLYAGLGALDASLRERGSRLIIRRGNPLNELTHLLDETGAQVIYAEPDYSVYACRRDHQVEKQFPVEWTGSPAVHPPGSVLKSNGEPYTVFTPFSRAWRALPAPQLPANDQASSSISTPGNIASLPLPDVPTDQNPDFPAGEAEAQRRLRAFICSTLVLRIDHRDNRHGRGFNLQLYQKAHRQAIQQYGVGNRSNTRIIVSHDCRPLYSQRILVRSRFGSCCVFYSGANLVQNTV